MRRLFIPALAAICAALVLALALPRFLAAVRYLPVDHAIRDYHASGEIPTDRLLPLIDFADEAIGIHDHYRFHDGLSVLHYLRALDLKTPAGERRSAYRQAEAEAVRTVTRAPAQPEAWLRIAMARGVLHDEPEQVIAAWKMSIFTGRTHSTLLVPRVQTGLAQFEFMDEEARSMLRDQLLLAWELKPAELLRILRWADRQLARTRELVGVTAPDMLAEMEERIGKIR